MQIENQTETLNRYILRDFRSPLKSHPSWATLHYFNIQALTDEEVDMFMSEADINGDGKLDYDEFVKIMLSY